MQNAIALSRKTQSLAAERQGELARTVIVLGAAFALIFAGQPLPL